MLVKYMIYTISRRYSSLYSFGGRECWMYASIERIGTIYTSFRETISEMSDTYAFSLYITITTEDSRDGLI
jgi:hypothetical protein